jgi:hypothetical protein
MTTPWTITAQWPGQTVAVLASGPSLTPALAQRLRLRVHRTIAVNHAHRLAPWADMLLALDGGWPDEYRHFAGLRVTGVADAELDALYIGPRWERVTLSPSHTVEIRNSGLTAVRVAALMGARRILLAGFDHASTTAHFYDDGDGLGYPHLREALAALTAELHAQGVAVEVVADDVGNPMPAKVAP